MRPVLNLSGSPRLRIQPKYFSSYFPAKIFLVAFSSQNIFWSHFPKPSNTIRGNRCWGIPSRVPSKLLVGGGMDPPTPLGRSAGVGGSTEGEGDGEGELKVDVNSKDMPPYHRVSTPPNRHLRFKVQPPTKEMSWDPSRAKVPTSPRVKYFRIQGPTIGPSWNSFKGPSWLCCVVLRCVVSLRPLSRPLPLHPYFWGTAYLFSSPHARVSSAKPSSSTHVGFFAGPGVSSSSQVFVSFVSGVDVERRSWLGVLASCSCGCSSVFGCLWALGLLASCSCYGSLPRGCCCCCC
jgi:hypothetical protein